MSRPTDTELLTAYAEQGSEAAFSLLVARYVDFVYAAAIRMAADPQIAKDVTQCVFIALARQARKLASRPVLSGWLHRTAHNLASATAASGVAAIKSILLMTSTQKLLGTASIALVIGAGVYEAQKAWRLEKEKVLAEGQLEPGFQKAVALRQERDRAVAELGQAQQQLDQLRRDIEEAGSLSREVSALREQVHALPPAKAAQTQSSTAATLMSLSERVSLLKRQLAQTPERKIPELQFANDNDWLEAAAAVKSDKETDLRKALSHLRTLAKDKVAPVLGGALRKYIQAHDGLLPSDMTDLKPYFDSPLEDAILQRYQVAGGKRLNELQPGQDAIQERSRVDETDALISVNPDRYGHQYPPQVVQGPQGNMTRTEAQSFSLPQNEDENQRPR